MVEVMRTSLQVAGAVAITVGASMVAIPVGLIVGGMLAILIGVALGR